MSDLFVFWDPDEAARGAPGFCATVVNNPDHADDVAKTVGEFIRDGLLVRTASREEAVAGLLAYHEWKTKPPHS